MEIVLSWLLNTAMGRIVGGVAGFALLGSVLFAGCEVRGCMKAREELQQYHRADKIRKEDPKVDKNIAEQKKRVDQMVTPDDFDRELERLRDYGTN